MNRIRSSRWIVPIWALLTIAMSVQMVRTQLSYFRYLFGDRFGWSSIQLGVLAIVFYALAFIVGSLIRWIGLRRLAAISSLVIAVARLLSQAWTGEPLVDFLLVSAGVFAFVVFVPALAGWHLGPHEANPQAAWELAVVFLSGLTLDAGLYIAFNTYDFIWQSGWLPMLLALLLVGTQLLALRLGLDQHLEDAPHQEPRLLGALSWLVLGPFLFYHLEIGQNVARLAADTGWQLPASATWLLAGQLLAVSLSRLWPPGRLAAIVGAGVLLATIVPLIASPWGIALSLTLSQIAAALLLTTAFVRLGRGRERQSVALTGFFYGLSILLFVLLAFAFYVTYDLALGYDRRIILYLTGGVIGLAGLLGAGRWFTPAEFRPGRLPLAMLPVCVVLAGIVVVTWRTPQPMSGAPAALRIVDYNLHNGFNTDGQLDLEALALTIEAQNPDIVALQEVSRGWIVNGSVDMLSWLSQRLGMAYAYGPSASNLWGHAVFSRYPIIDHQVHPLPPPDLPLTRSFAYHEIDVGRSEPLRLINTHYHHVAGDDTIRTIQSEAILSFLGDRTLTRFVMTGDLNAEPEDKSIQLLLQRGFQDAVGQFGPEPAFTYSSVAPENRIDYILISPDLGAQDIVIPRSTASDHLGIAATITLP